VRRAYYSPRYYADIGSHVMPIRKFALVAQGIDDAGLPLEIVEPERASDTDILRVHSAAYVEAMRTGQPPELASSQKFPWSPELAEAVRWTNGGCIDALRHALDTGVCGNLASGFHHSHRDRGEGFCTYNGLVVSYERMVAEGRLRRALVVDMDLHYGNGTAFLLRDRPDLFALSIYGNWYDNNLAARDVRAQRTPDTANSWSVPVDNGTGRDGYLDLLEEHLPLAFERARPDVVLFQAGADPLNEDPYSPLDLDHAALMERDRRVFQACKARGVPVMWVLAGGYTPDVSRVVLVHVNTARACVEVFGEG
jgi:acetoin utilization deacetylase AcuC-like enzyme